MCRSGCNTQNHATFGECARAANIQIDRFSLVGNNQPLEKQKEHTLERYRQARASGFQPEGCLKTDMDKFEASLSDKKPVKVTND